MNFLPSLLLPDILEAGTQYPSVPSGQLCPRPLRAQGTREDERGIGLPSPCLTDWPQAPAHNLSQLLHSLTPREAVSLKEKGTQEV